MTAEETFEGALSRLEAVVRELESGELPLDDAIARFEEGLRLSGVCRERLAAVEARVVELLDDGELVAVRLDE